MWQAAGDDGGGWPLQMQPQRQDAHRAFVPPGLVFSSLFTMTESEAQIDSIWWLLGDSYTVGAAHLQIHPNIGLDTEQCQTSSRITVSQLHALLSRTSC